MLMNRISLPVIFIQNKRTGFSSIPQSERLINSDDYNTLQDDRRFSYSRKPHDGSDAITLFVLSLSLGIYQLSKTSLIIIDALASIKVMCEAVSCFLFIAFAPLRHRHHLVSYITFLFGTMLRCYATFQHATRIKSVTHVAWMGSLSLPFNRLMCDVNGTVLLHPRCENEGKTLRRQLVKVRSGFTSLSVTPRIQTNTKLAYNRNQLLLSRASCLDQKRF